jgi:hypothetical protein
LAAAIGLLQRTRSRWCFFCFGVLVGAGLPGTSGAAQQFSADLLGTTVASGATPTTGKIYVSTDKVRIETSDFPGGFFLLGGNAHTAHFVKSTQRIVMDARQSSWLTQILVPLDPNDPCRQWQAMAEIAGATERRQWRCDRLSLPSASGRSMIKYRAISPEGAANDSWIDPQLGFVLSVHRDDGAAIDLENIQEEPPPPAGLFEIPADFRTFDPHQLIDRIKHSDVWVEPPR